MSEAGAWCYSKSPTLGDAWYRSFTARPVFSTDDPNVDKHKLERFLHDRRQCVATIYGPIQYPPLPLLAFKITPDHPPQLALAGQQLIGSVSQLVHSADLPPSRRVHPSHPETACSVCTYAFTVLD